MAEKEVTLSLDEAMDNLYQNQNRKFKQRANKKLNEIFLSSLKNMKRRGLIDYKKEGDLYSIGLLVDKESIPKISEEKLQMHREKLMEKIMNALCKEEMKLRENITIEDILYVNSRSGHGNLSNTEGHQRFASIKQSAAKRKINFTLDYHEFINWYDNTENICYYCDSTLFEYNKIKNCLINYCGNNYDILKYKILFNNKRFQKISSITIDRKNNDLGYEFDNIVKSCWICNSTKNQCLTETDMLNLAPKMISDLKEEFKKEGLWNETNN